MISTKGMAFILSAALTTTLVACAAKDGEQRTTGNENAVPVTVTKPSGSVAGNTITVSGQVEASQTAGISTRVMGYINRIYVRVGDRVKTGQMLVSVNSADMNAKRAQTDAAISQAEAALINAKKDYDRFVALYSKQSATAKELDNVTLQYKAAGANLEAAKQMRNEVNAQFSYTNITAPFDGIVTQKMIDAGSMATPGMPILVIEKAGSFQVTASVPESEIGLLQPGSMATMQVKSTGKTMEGKVSEISRSSQFTGGQYLIRIDVPAGEKEGLYAGMYVNVSIPVAAAGNKGNAGAVLVPRSAIVTRDQLTGLYTISQENTALLRWVRLGNAQGDNVEVLSGLSAGEQFILRADGKLYNGVPVLVR